jgi:omega-3 fatty acid desaturase (delta-15 desaturase)
MIKNPGSKEEKQSFEPFKKSTNGTNYIYETDILADIPTLSEIKRAIPVECFQSNVWKSMFYVVKDTALIFILYTCLCYLEKFNMNRLIYCIVYPLYWYFQGVMYTAYFIVGHDCGHGSFSRYPIINDTIGNILHTFILVPYYPW